MGVAKDGDGRSAGLDADGEVQAAVATTLMVELKSHEKGYFNRLRAAKV